MGFLGMIASMLLGIFLIMFGISRRKHKVLPIILIALGIVFVHLAAEGVHAKRGSKERRIHACSL